MERVIDPTTPPQPSERHPAKVDVAVLVLLFNRPDMLAKLFKQIRQARPSRLLFYQDGARNEADLKHMMECRAVVDDNHHRMGKHHRYVYTIILCILPCSYLRTLRLFLKA